MPQIGRKCHELRISDEGVAWRIVYRIDTDAVLILAVFPKKSTKTPGHIIRGCQRRLKAYDGE